VPSRWPRAGHRKGKDVGTSAPVSASADPGHVHTAVGSTVASWLVFTRYRSSSLPGTQPTPACRLVVRGACKRLTYIFQGFVFPGLIYVFSCARHPKQPMHVDSSDYRDRPEPRTSLHATVVLATRSSSNRLPYRFASRSVRCSRYSRLKLQHS
jgi:hypothetical protein